MKLKIIFLSLVVLALAVGVVSASSITDYNAPVGFDRNPVTFSHGDFEMDMKSYSSFMDYDDYFNSTDDKKVQINGTHAEYVDNAFKKVGAAELVEIDGETYVVYCTYDKLDANKTKECFKYLEEFNDVNKFKAVEIK